MTALPLPSTVAVTSICSVVGTVGLFDADGYTGIVIANLCVTTDGNGIIAFDIETTCNVPFYLAAGDIDVCVSGNRATISAAVDSRCLHCS